MILRKQDIHHLWDIIYRTFIIDRTTFIYSFPISNLCLGYSATFWFITIHLESKGLLNLLFGTQLSIILLIIYKSSFTSHSIFSSLSPAVW